VHDEWSISWWDHGFSPPFCHPILPWFIDFIIMVDVYEIDWTRKNMGVFQIFVGSMLKKMIHYDTLSFIKHHQWESTWYCKTAWTHTHKSYYISGVKAVWLLATLQRPYQGFTLWVVHGRVVIFPKCQQISTGLSRNSPSSWHDPPMFWTAIVRSLS
jgi:hypothetical protein